MFGTTATQETKALPSLGAAATSLGFFKPVAAAKKILVVEDILLNQKLLTRMLAGYSCVVANNGQEAVAAVKNAAEQNAPFDLIFMDIEMPIMDGRDATAAIRSLGFDTPIVCVSTLVSSATTLPNGMNDFINKKLDRAQVSAITKKYTEVGAVSINAEQPKAESNSYSFWSQSAPRAIANAVPASPTVSLSSFGLASSPSEALPQAFAELVNQAPACLVY